MEQVKTSRRQVKTIMSVKLIKFIFSRTVVNILSCIPDNLHYTVMVVIGNLLTSFSFIPLQLSTSFFYTYAHHLTAFYQRFSISSHTHPSLSRCSFLLCHHSDSGQNFFYHIEAHNLALLWQNIPSFHIKYFRLAIFGNRQAFERY